MALLFLCGLLRVVSLLRPCFSDDEAIYAVVAREMLSGQVLYRDVVDHKPPAIYAVYALAMEIGGGNAGGMVVLHLFAIGTVWMTGLVIAGILRPIGRGDDEDEDPRTPFMGALLWIVFSTFYFDVDSLAVNCELPMILPIVASAALFLAARGRLAWLGAAGALVGIATLFKYQAAVQLVFYAVVLDARRLRSWLALGLSALAPWALVALGLWHAGALADAIFWFRFNFAYVQTGFASVDLLQRGLVAVGVVVFPSFLLYGLGLRTAVAGENRFATGWMIASALAVAAGGRFFGHYFHQLAAPLVVLAAPRAVRLLQRRPALFAFGTVVPAVGFLALGALHTPVMRWVGDPDPDYAAVARFLDARAPRSESMCVWGNAPVLYFEAERPLGCRFVFATNYLTGLSPATKTQTDPGFDASPNIVPAAWDMLVADLEVRRPRFIIDGSPGNVGYYGKFPPSRFPRLADILNDEFVPVAEVSGMRVWERRRP